MSSLNLFTVFTRPSKSSLSFAYNFQLIIHIELVVNFLAVVLRPSSVFLSSMEKGMRHKKEEKRVSEGDSIINILIFCFAHDFLID